MRSMLSLAIEKFGGIDVIIEHINDALGHAGDVQDSKPELNDVAHFLSSCSCESKDLISLLHFRDRNLFKEIFVCDVAAIFGDPEDQNPLSRTFVIDSFSVPNRLAKTKCFLIPIL